MSGRFHFDVVVAGGGPVGLLAGLAAARKGLVTAVLEEQWRPPARSYALALHPASSRLFDSLGIEPEILGRANLVEEQSFYGEGRRQAELSYTGLDGLHAYVLILPENELERLLAAAVEQAGGKVFWGHRLSAFEQGADGVDLRVDRLTEESTGYAVGQPAAVVEATLSLRASFLIGADGNGSLVRRSLGIEFPSVGEAATFAVFEFGSVGPTSRELSVVFERDSASVFWPLTKGRMRWGFELPEFDRSVDPRLKNRLFVHFRDEAYPYVAEDKLAELVSQRAPWFHVHIAEMYWSTVVRFEQRLADSFGKNRVWLAGDAAHLALPMAVHSMNLGFQEGAELAERIAKIVHKGASLDEVGAYGEHRRRVWRQLVERVSNPKVDPHADGWIRDNASRIAASIPASGEDLIRLLDPLGISV